MAPITIVPEHGPIPEVALRFEDGTLYQPEAVEPGYDPSPRRTGTVIPRTADARPTAAQGRPSSTASSDRVPVVFQMDGHTIRSEFRSVTVSRFGTYLIFDATDCPNVFLPFHQMVQARPEQPVASVIALPSGSGRAYSLSVSDAPPWAATVGGSVLYGVPIADASDVDADTLSQFADFLQPSTSPSPLPTPEVTSDQNRSDRTEHPDRPVRPTREYDNRPDPADEQPESGGHAVSPVLL